MGFATGVILPGLLWLVAWALARRELRSYRESAADGTDLFIYSRGRLVRRLVGVGAIAAIGATLLVMELGADSPVVVTVCGAVLAALLVVLIAIPLLDLRETARTARPERLERAGMTRRQLDELARVAAKRPR